MVGNSIEILKLLKVSKGKVRKVQFKNGGQFLFGIDYVDILKNEARLINALGLEYLTTHGDKSIETVRESIQFSSMVKIEDILSLK